MKMKRMSDKNRLAVLHWRDVTLARATELRLISLDDAAEVLTGLALEIGNGPGCLPERPIKSPRRTPRKGKINPESYRDKPRRV